MKGVLFYLPSFIIMHNQAINVNTVSQIAFGWFRYYLQDFLKIDLLGINHNSKSQNPKN